MDIISAIYSFITDIFTAAANFMENPATMAELEERITAASHNTNAQILGQILELYDSFLRELPAVKSRYIIQRSRERTLITTFGDVTFKRTLYRSREDGTYHYLMDEKMQLPRDEHFSALAEVEVLKEATKSSYQRAADRLQIGGQSISKVAVMNKVHGVLEELPLEQREPKKACEYLYIEADEDHVHRQKAGREVKGDCIIAKLVYVYEGKEEVCKGRRRLISPTYLGGRYAGSEANKRLWERVDEYIRKNYDTEVLKKVYIIGDGGAWIKAGCEYVGKSEFVADKYHLMKYINAASRQMLDEAEETKGKFYRHIYKNRRKKAQKLLTRMKNSASNPKPVEALENFLMNNWDAVQRAYKDKHVYGCSAEGHVSHIYADRMSSRPMGWSETGSDRMCRLRCLVSSEGEKKIIDLVEARREKIFEERLATGTDGIQVDRPMVNKRFTPAQKEMAAYAEAMHARFTSTLIRKQIAIKLRMNDL